VATAAALLDVLRVDVVAERRLQRVETALLWVAVVAVGDESDVVAGGRAFDRPDRLLDEQVAVLGVFGAFEVRGPRVLVNVVRHRVRAVVVS
jgi:hypothetical protein